MSKLRKHLSDAATLTQLSLSEAVAGPTGARNPARLNALAREIHWAVELEDLELARELIGLALSGKYFE